VKNSDLLIDYQCPQCGAPATLSEVDRLFTCEYCRVRSYLLSNGSFRYVLPHKAPAGADLIYVPYWRFKGMLFSFSTEGIQHRFFDVSLPALEVPQLPASLGLRSQTQKLRFANPEMPGRFLEPHHQRRAILVDFSRQLSRDLSSGVLHQAHIGEALSLIYAPVYERRQLIDAVLNRPLASAPGPPLENLPGGRSRWRLSFLATLCPKCGWELEGSRDALALSCRNCVSMFTAGRRGWEPIGFATLASTAQRPVYLPFWRIQADVSGVSLATYADLARLANLPQAPRSAWDDVPFHFWSPAFKVRPATFFRLARGITLAFPASPLKEELPAGPVIPANLPPREGVEILKVNLASFMRPPKLAVERLASIRIVPRKYRLVYVPFEDRHHELVQPAMRLAISKSQLALAVNL
jgi:hypothetical protein